MQIMPAPTRWVRQTAMAWSLLRPGYTADPERTGASWTGRNNHVVTNA
jgi:hypothetical protein